MDKRKESSRLQRKEVYKGVYRTFYKPVYQSRHYTDICKMSEAHCDSNTITSLVKDGILVKESRGYYSLAISRNKLWERMERL